MLVPKPTPDARAADVQRLIDALRPKLIDLTGRNRLISLRHSEKSRREVRVVAPNLAAIWEQLMNGGAARFESLPPLPLTQKTSILDWARMNGVPTDFEEGDAAESAATLRTIYLPDEFERRLSGIDSTARLSLTERGATALFGMFGFLEWYDSDAAAASTFSPLLTIPLSMTRERVAGTYRYAAKWSGEEPSVNIAIVERLAKDLKFPLFEGEDPDAWLSALEESLPKGARPWRVHRWLTIGILDFMRLPMWADLARWKVGPLVLDVFGSIPTDPPPPIPEEAVDTPSMRELVPFTVLDADSSQFRALAEAMRGRSIVIQGPPGTGKSQTITNLIALALHRGKRVLFVSEKQAALEVVRNRLEHVGLGPYCLTLHSARSDKKTVIAELHNRLEQRPALRTAAVPQPHALDAERATLNAVPAALQRKISASGLTLHHAIGRLHASRRRTPKLPFALHDAPMTAVERWDEPHLGRARQACSDVQTAWDEALSPTERLLDHPWFELVTMADSVPDQERTLTLSTELHSALSGYLDARAKLSTACPSTATVGDEELIAFYQRLRAFPAPTAGGPDAWMRSVGTWHGRQAMDDVLRRLRIILSEEAAIRESFEREAPELPSSDALQAQIERAVALGVHERKLRDLADAADHRRRHATEWTQAGEESVRIWNALGFSDVPTCGKLVDIENLAAAVVAFPDDTAPLRNQTLTAPDCTPLLAEARQYAAELSGQLATEQDWFDITLNPDEATVHADVLATSSWWSIFSVAWWQARSYYNTWARPGQNVGARERAQRLRGVAKLLTDAASFAADTRLKTHLGSAFRALDTNWDPLFRLTKWADEVRAAARPLAAANVEAGLLWRDRERVQLVRGAYRSGLLKEAASRLGQTYAEVPTVQMHARLSEEARGVGQLRQTLTRMGLRPDVKLNALGALSARLAEMEIEREDLLREAASLLKDIPNTDLVVAAAAAEQCIQFASLMSDHSVPAEVARWTFEAEPVERLAMLRVGTGAAAQRWSRVRHAKSGAASGPAALARAVATSTSTQALQRRLSPAVTAPQRLPQLIRLLQMRAALDPLGVRSLLDAHERASLAPTALPNVFERVHLEILVATALRADGVLSHFDGVAHESLRRRFASADADSMTQAAAHVVQVVAQTPIDSGVRTGRIGDYTGAALIRHVARQDRPRIAIRDLFERAGQAIGGIAPCLLMSPLSVAQYLKPGALEFDLVVMDEASQLRPEEAVGALLRARQAVIVGDPMQMPPSDFFRAAAVTSGEPEDDEGADELEESILDVAARQLHPFSDRGGSMPKLLWHYRSKHPSLITYSNYEFYDGELVLFPASDASTDAGVGLTLELLKDGVYGSSVNIREAQAVAAAAIEEIQARPERSLGVVALNIQQKELIEAEIERFAQADAVISKYIANWKGTLSPFFVKNLENVQGDERDTIIISTVFGPDSDNKFAQNFGVLNRLSGPRRLNVLFSRAVYRMRVITSMDWSRISAPSQGAKTLKNFLKFASTGQLERPTTLPGSPVYFSPDSPFEQAVLDELKTMGFAADPQIGEGRYRIDIGIRHPTIEGRYVLGIECDGATYHSSRSARDRDRLRQRVLEELGWKIHRIWSTDWFRGPNAEVRRLREVIEARFTEIALQQRSRPAQLVIPSTHTTASAAAPPRSALPDTASASRSGVAGSATTTTKHPPAALDQKSVPSAAPRQVPQVDAARPKLLALRDRIRESSPAVSEERLLLRDAMVEALLRTRPTSVDEFRNRLPLSLRENIDRTQTKHFEEVFEIFAGED